MNYEFQVLVGWSNGNRMPCEEHWETVAEGDAEEVWEMSAEPGDWEYSGVLISDEDGECGRFVDEDGNVVDAEDLDFDDE